MPPIERNGLSTPEVSLQILSLLPVAVYTTNRDGFITFFNKAAAELWGRCPEIGKDRWCGSQRIFKPDGTSLPLEQSSIGVSLRESRDIHSEELEIERPDGHRVQILAYPQLLRDAFGAIIGAMNTLVDITDQKQAAADQRLLAAIVESSDDAIISKNLDGIITSWNKGAEHLFGYSAQEAIGKHISFLVPPEHANDVDHVLSQVRRGECVDHYRTKRRAKDGRILDISLTVSPIRNGGGQIIGASKVARDITTQKRTDDALKESERQLRESNRRKDEFLAMLAHELRNPLSAISSAVHVARKSELNEPLAWSTEVIERQARQLTRLIDDLLDVSRITRGKIRLHKEVVDINLILQNAMDTVRPLIEERKHDLRVSSPPETLRVQADPFRLEQVVVNLLTNAAKYTESGGQIKLVAEAIGNDAVIRVRDSGIGLAPEKLSQVFELFVQDERSLARSEGGLGIGLTLVKTLIEMQNGTVSASSDGPGKGSEFTVRLPAVKDAIRRPAPHAPVVNHSKQVSRILVVDDNADAARGLARLLKLLGHDVQTAHDGPEAIAMAQAYQPEVLLLDIGLPGIDGYGVAKRLREHGTNKDCLIIAISGYGQEEDRRRGREAGFDHHLVKPIDPNTLLTLLSKD